MKVTIDVREYDWAPSGYHPDDESPDCTICHEPIEALAVRLPGVRGFVHATDSTSCLQQATKYIEEQGPAFGWLLIAESVAAVPHKHTAATIRATIQNLAAMAASAQGSTR